MLIADLTLLDYSLYECRVTKEIETTGTIKVEANNLKAESVFNILLSDYNVKIPQLVGEKISNNIKITTNTNLEKLNG